MFKTIFIAHPISGDVENNLKKVMDICKEIHTVDTIPIFPSSLWRNYLPVGDVTKHWAGLVNDEYFKRGMVDEVWVYGEIITEGMKKEIDLAYAYEIPVIFKGN
jgi:hypothetical protein